MTDTETTSDPIAILLAEHQSAERQFAAYDVALSRVADGGDEAVTRVLELTDAMLTYLDTDLETHLAKEEEPLFPRIKAALPADDRLIDEMIAEHDQVRLKRDDLRAAVSYIRTHTDDEMRDAREQLRTAARSVDRAAVRADQMSTLVRTGRMTLRTLRVHFQNEEELVFPLAIALLPAETLALVGAEMIRIDGAGLAASPDPSPPAVATTDLTDQYTALLASPEVARDGRTARTLIKESGLRVVLLALRAGGRLHDHHAAGPLTIHALAGHVVVRFGDAAPELRAGQLLALPSRLMHAVEAVEDSALLLTMSLPG